MSINTSHTDLKMDKGTKIIMCDTGDNEAEWSLTIHNGEIRIEPLNDDAKKLSRNNKIDKVLNE